MMQTYTHNVYRVHAFAALVSFPLDPMAVEVGEEAVDVVGTGGVSVPFLGIVLEQCLVLQGFGVLRGR